MPRGVGTLGIDLRTVVTDLGDARGAGPPGGISLQARMMAKHTARTPATPGVLTDPLRHRGVGFTQADRDELGLTGRLPSAVLTLEQQPQRAYQQLQAQHGDLAKNGYLEQLHDRNETLYYKVLTDHLVELLPVVYDPTVGEAIEKYSHEYRRPRGVFLSIDVPEDIEKARLPERPPPGVLLFR